MMNDDYNRELTVCTRIAAYGLVSVQNREADLTQSLVN